MIDVVSAAFAAALALSGLQSAEYDRGVECLAALRVAHHHLSRSGEPVTDIRPAQRAWHDRILTGAPTPTRAEVSQDVTRAAEGMSLDRALQLIEGCARDVGR